MEAIAQLPVTFTADAVEEIRNLMKAEGFDGNQYLRVGVKGGGCSGLSYVLGFDEKLQDDEIFEFEGIPVVMNPGHQMYLFGMQIDWLNGLNNRGFTFNNPNAAKTCGCGTSFSS
jgi:iron-sulfur cluster assembly protein